MLILIIYCWVVFPNVCSEATELLYLSQYGLIPEELIPEILLCRESFANSSIVLGGDGGGREGGASKWNESNDTMIDIESLQIRVLLELEDVSSIIYTTLLDIAHSRLLFPSDLIADLQFGDVRRGGVIARTVQEILHGNRNNIKSLSTGTGTGTGTVDSSYGSTNTKILSCFEHIETPMQQLARAGLGLLSTGLGR